MAGLEVQIGRAHWRRMAVLAVLFGAMGAALVPLMAQRGAAFAVIGLGMVVAPFAIMARSLRSWPRRFDDRGVELRSGARFAWSDLEAVIEVHVRGALNHYALRFRGGTARVYPRVIENCDAVMELVHAMHRGPPPV